MSGSSARLLYSETHLAVTASQAYKHKKATPRGGFLIVSSRHVTSPAVEYGRWWGKFYLASRYFRRGLPPNYRCRCCVSHPSSRWIGVVPQRYGHQERSTTLAIDPPFPGVIPENCIGYFKASCQQAQPMALHGFEILEDRVTCCFKDWKLSFQSSRLVKPSVY